MFNESQCFTIFKVRYQLLNCIEKKKEKQNTKPKRMCDTLLQTYFAEIVNANILVEIIY